MAGKIFINYRRDDTIAAAGRLHDRLAQAFGRRNLFLDVDHIPAGVDFASHLNEQVGSCDVFLAVIGPKWIASTDETGARRIDNPEDFVAIEIAAALARDIRVIPVLIDGAPMPRPAELPEHLRPLARRNAIEVRNSQFGRDAEVLVEKIRAALKSEKAGGGGRSVIAAGVVAVLMLGGGVLAYQVGVPMLWAPAREASHVATNDAPAKMSETAKKSADGASAQADTAKKFADEARTRSRQLMKKVGDDQKAQRAAEERERQRMADASAGRPKAAFKGEQRFPILSYRTGAYATIGVPLTNGMVDYYKLVNERDGGVNGVRPTFEECETGYATDKGVECYERLKNRAAFVSSPSTGITITLTDKAPQEQDFNRDCWQRAW